MSSRTALITGITGQDGSYLAEFLLEKGYRVCGMARRTSADNIHRINHIRSSIELYYGDLIDQTAIASIVNAVQPDEVYNLAALSFVPASWQRPVMTAELTAVAVTRILDALRKACPRARVFQAGSSEMFGQPKERPQSETTPFHPCTPYGIAKLHGHNVAVAYRKSYGMHISCGIMYNHESPRRGLEYVTRKITDGVARIKLGLASELRLGQLNAQRDWGYARDYVQAMWLMLQQDEPGDYVIGTGETHSVEEFVQAAFEQAGLNWKDHVVVDSAFFRPADVGFMQADAGKARQKLGWSAQVRFAELVRLMIDADLERVENSPEENLRSAA